MPRTTLRGAVATAAAAGVLASLTAAAPLPAFSSPAPSTLADGKAVENSDPLDPSEARAHWIDTGTVVWPMEDAHGHQHRLLTHQGGALGIDGGEVTGIDGAGSIDLTPTELTDEQREQVPHLADEQAFQVAEEDVGHLADALRGQLLAVQESADGGVTRATGVQLPGVLDDLYAADATDAELGPIFTDDGTTQLAVWAPTAQQVTLELDGDLLPMERDDASGIWSADDSGGDTGDWYGAPYRYHVDVWAPEAQEIVTNEVTDPYSTALTTDSQQSLIIDLDDPDLVPPDWDDHQKPDPVALHEAAIQELHVRDFSVGDDTAEHPGSYLAFTEDDTDGTDRLQALSEAGTTHAHLLPTNDLGSIPEDQDAQREPDCDLAALPPDSAAQQECIGEIRAEDAYNAFTRQVGCRGSGCRSSV